MPKTETYSVYMHRLKSDGRVYIGQSKNPRVRWYGQGTTYKRNTRFWSAIQEHGWDSFEHIVIESGLTKEEANILEEYHIAVNNATDPLHGFNCVSRGHTSGIITEEARQNYREAQLGRHHSEETKRKIGKAHKGRKFSKEALENMSRSHKGHVTSPEHRQALIEASVPYMRPVRCVETGVVYRGIREAERQTGICHQAIGNCLSGVQKVTHGCHWEYCEQGVV